MERKYLARVGRVRNVRSLGIPCEVVFFTGKSGKLNFSRYRNQIQGGLEALPMIQRVKARASFHRCKQNLVIIQGYLQVFTWLLLRFGSLL